MAGQFQDKVALVTGGSSGIGRETAIAFAKEGAKVVVADIDVEGGEQTVAQIESHDGDSFFVRADVSQAGEVEAMVQETVRKYGRLDCAINNAGVGGGGFIWELAEEVWDRVIAVDLKGVWLCMKYEVPVMLKQGGGAIVNMSSVSGLVARPRATPYVAAKHGVVGITKTVALECAQRGIRVNAVCPGPIETPGIAQGVAVNPSLRDDLLAGTPMGRFGEPPEVASAVLWLCSDAASFVTGHALLVDGARTAQ